MMYIYIYIYIYISEIQNENNPARNARWRVRSSAAHWIYTRKLGPPKAGQTNRQKPLIKMSVQIMKVWIGENS